MFKVFMAHHPNPDLVGGYWSLPAESGSERCVVVSSFSEAAKVYRVYLDRNGLGGGNSCFARIADVKGVTVAVVSYNGRIWAPDGRELPGPYSPGMRVEV